MSRLMPGRIRQQGIDLYEAGKLVVDQLKNDQLRVTVGSEVFLYSSEDHLLSCSCQLFAQKGYCQHLAATEYFLKNDPQGREIAQEIENTYEDEFREKEASLAGLFLDQLLSGVEKEEVRYQLAVQGQLVVYDTNIDWTLKIRRLPDERLYIIRDISSFLKQVKAEKQYQIGKNYYEQVAYGQFDASSQAVIDFLWKFVPEKSTIDSDILKGFGRYLRLPLVNFEEGIELFQSLSYFQFDDQQDSYDSLTIFPLVAEAGLYRFRVEAHKERLELRMIETPSKPILQGAYLLAENKLYQVDREQARLLEIIGKMLPLDNGERQLSFPSEEQDRLAVSLLELQKIGQVEAPKQFRIEDFEPEFHLSLAKSGEIFLQLLLDFSGKKVSNQADLFSLPFAIHEKKLASLFFYLQDLGFEGAFESTWNQQNLYLFFTDTLARLRERGSVYLDANLEEQFIQEPPQIQVTPNGGLLDIAFDFQGIAEEEIGQALSALLQDASHFTSQTGKVLIFDEETKRISQTLQNLRSRFGQAGHLSVQSLAAPQLMDNLSQQDNIHFSAEFGEMVDLLRQPEQLSLPDFPLASQLRDYQTLGVKWLTVLNRYGFGGILADEMGLGKTVQVIAFLQQQLTSQSRVLILAPSSLIYNWQEECRHFAPQLDVVVVHGSKEKRLELISEGHQVLVTSYASFRQDAQFYGSKQYDYLILDEAQVMKNSQTKIAQLLRDFEVGNCFALSGTPIENNLAELWSIFQIVLPGLLPPRLRFNKLTAQEVARLVQPFLLRRKKEDVLQELPDLIEITALNELKDEQKAIYLAQLRQMQGSIQGATDADINRRKIEILAGITRLRQICDTPSLFLPNYTGDSGKLESLRDLLLQLKEGGHRVLIFSQFRSMLEKIEQELSDLDLSSYLLTGSTPAPLRQEMTQSFNAGNRDAFLISLKAGGVGLNLTGADTVILVDLWWNPAVEAQAISRAHRMGQTETVECYRLITRGTIEEKIQELQESKKHLITTVLDGNESRSTMSVDDIREILGLSD